MRIYSEDIGMEFDKEKFVMVMKRGKQQMKEEIKLPNKQKNQNARRIRNLQVLENIRSGNNQTGGDRKKLSISGERKKQPTWNQTI